MKYACNKCLKVIRDFELKGCLKVTVHRAEPGGNKEILLCNDCRPGFWAAVDSDIEPIRREGGYGKS